MKIYLAGKITGDAHYREKFAAQAARLRGAGHEVSDPTTLPQDKPYDELLERSMQLLEQCEAVYFLPDWIDSFGAKREYLRARELGLKLLPTEQTMYICDPLRAVNCDKNHCYIRILETDRRCAFTPILKQARLRPGGEPIAATPELIADYIRFRRA